MTLPPGFVLEGEEHSLPEGFVLEGEPDSGAVAQVAKEGIGNLEALGALASGVVAEPLAGIAGIGAAIVPGGRTGAEAVEATREALTFQPRTEAGERRVQQIGGALEPVGRALETTEDFLGHAVFDLTGSPALAAGAATTPTLVLEALGLGALRKMRVGTRLIDDSGRPTKALRKQLNKQGLEFETLTPESKALIPVVADQSFIAKSPIIKPTTEKALVEQIKSGGKDDALASLMVIGDKVSPDQMAAEAIKQGFDQGFVQSVKTASGGTKRRMKNMLSDMRKIKASRRASFDIRPSNEVGNAVAGRIKVVRDATSRARKELDQIASKNLTGLDIDAAPVVGQLEKSLSDLNIRLIDGPKGKPVPDFKLSDVAKDRTSQRIIKDAIDLLAEGGKPDAMRFHRLKRQLDKMIDFRKKSAGGLTDAGKGVLKDLRRSLNDSLRAADQDYARVNDTLSSGLTALDDFQQASGRSIDIFGEGSSKAIGTNMRSLMSNRQTRVNLDNALNQLEDTAKSLGGVFDDNVKDLVMFADGIEDVFGATARTSLKGELESALKQTGQQGVKATAAQKVVEKAAEGAEKLRGINEFNAFEAMSDLLNR